jgi:hypothetical protein
MGQIKGSVTYCNEAGASSFEPVVTLHHRDGKMAATRVWHGVDVPGEPTNGSVHFVFSEPAGYYYLTQGNDYPIPPQARQIHLHARQTFTAHIDDCAGSAAAVAQEAQEARQVRQAFVKAQATMAAQRAAAERAAALEPKCTQTEVHITTSPGVPHMGGFSELISVENSGRTTCSLGLYPLLAFHSALSPSIYTAGPSSSTPNEPSNVPVVLAHEETASAIFSGADMPTGTQTSCPTFSSFTANIAEGTPATVSYVSGQLLGDRGQRICRRLHRDVSADGARPWSGADMQWVRFNTRPNCPPQFPDERQGALLELCISQLQGV